MRPARPTILALLVLAGCDSLPYAPEAGIAGDGQLDVSLEHLRDFYALPALGAMTIHRGEVIDVGAVGQRSLDFPDRVTVDDEWLIGALTMSMTATVAGVLVDRGTIDWQTTIGQVFPDLIAGMNSDYVSVTLEMLLSHQSGLPASFVTPIFTSLYDSPDPLEDQRRAWIVEILDQESGTVGQYAYSNGGYIVAAAMLEEASGRSWESLVQTELFDPLGMTGAGFGPSWSEGDATQPHGHGAEGTGYDPSDPERFPLAASPALGVHLTFADYAKYLIAQVLDEKSKHGVVSAATAEKLLTPVASTEDGMRYALGWKVVRRGWAPDPVLEHGGAVGGFNAVVWVAPGIDLAMFAVTNSLMDQTPAAIDNALQVLLQRFLVPG